VKEIHVRPSWDEYFMMIAKLSAVRSTCLAFPVGAVIVKDRQILATGYNGSPPGSPHCTAQGFCYEGLQKCTDNNLPSRSIHAEANAIAQAAKHGIRTDGATIYVTLEPCFLGDGLVKMKAIQVSAAAATQAADFLMNPISIPKSV
jgi:dCMP deaminase